MRSFFTESWLTRSFLWLILAVPLLLAATGERVVAAAPWIAPILLLRFARQQPAGRGYALVAMATTGVLAVTWADMVPFDGTAYYAFVAVQGLLFALPYLADRLFAVRLPGLAASLVFPAAAVTVEYAASFGPFGTWGSVAYTQESLALLQLTSITGIWGITFLINWTASVGNAVWEEGLTSPSIRWTTGVWGGLLAATLLLGGTRLALMSPDQTVPVATVMGRHDTSSFWDLRREAKSRKAVRDSARAVQRDYLGRARQAAEAGARLVTWAETAVPVPREDTTAFLDRARTLAASHEVYLAMAVNEFPRAEAEARLQNKVVWIGPSGTVHTEGLKTHLVPGEPGQAGTGTLPTVSTPAGMWSSAICFDLDFPSLIRQAGQNGVDLLVAPSNDWAAVAERHAHMARVRAIENGTALLRPASKGHTLATGPLGRTRARVNHFTTEEYVQMAHLPTDGPSTLYAALGDVFAWGCGLGLLFLIGGAYVRLKTSAQAETARAGAA
ncbi:nitrilase-related carbon-nitrogen hydrolase [Salinibacter altiplanensis]|uniref:nitrilase-related carbon-nitrogen hydrolase n=1 Tax=Salinibacter altiplanensis TaxID=1803181 RepID=UPI000C9EF8BD|nr:nitrilase-related carbon-nitrogen hydrolase [Salinibacter altiplanensis]